MTYRLDVTKLNPEGFPPFEKKKQIHVVFINVTDYDQKTQFLICCTAIFILYVLYGYLQELIFTQESFKQFGWFITLVQFAFYSVFAKLECYFKQNTKRRVSLKVYALLAFLTLGTMGFSNSSLMYLNYPMQVIFKCCKLIPVMIGSILIQGKKYKFIDYMAVFCMCAGLSYFTLADSGISPYFNFMGIFMISCALMCDAAIGNVQEKNMNSTGASNTEIVLYSYSIGFIYLLLIMCLTGELTRGIVFSADKPMIVFYTFFFSLTGYLGVQVVLTLVKMSGALVAVTVTTCRKAISIIISFIFFSKPFTMHYVWAGMIVVLGIYLNLMSKNSSKFNFGNWILRLKNMRISKQNIKSIETTV